jgi:hypothetical protein
MIDKALAQNFPEEQAFQSQTPSSRSSLITIIYGHQPKIKTTIIDGEVDIEKQSRSQSIDPDTGGTSTEYKTVSWQHRQVTKDRGISQLSDQAQHHNSGNHSPAHRPT